MAKEIFTQDVFEKQVNGTVFQKEGRLQDFPYAGEGVFESWKYSFDAGKQVFRGSTTGKVFEKRIIKDINGNPQWTTWVEIPDAEAHGIQAIAINDRPLQLPNSDGAIKLQITPQMIDTYTKGEIYQLIDRKIEDQISGAYIYVKWVEGATSAKDVLEKTFPDGGIIGTFYLVEPHQGTSGLQEDAEYFIWIENSVGKFDWQSIEIPDMRAFVSYPVFNEHTKDGHFHLQGDFERQKWNAASGLLYEVSGKLEQTTQELYNHIDSEISGIVVNLSDVYKHIEQEAEIADKASKEVEDKLIKHSNLIGERNSPHVTEAERLHWNAAFTNSIRALPDDGQRYVALNNGYQLAFEQAKKGDEVNEKVFDSPSIFAKSGQAIISDLLPKFNSIFNGNLLTDAQLEVGGLNTQGVKVKFETFGDTDDVSKISNEFATGDMPIWKIGNKAFDKILIVSEDKDKSFTLTNVKLYLRYKKLISAEIGNSNLPLNLVGVDRNVTEPTYNGESIFDIATEKVNDTLDNFSGIIETNNTELNDKLDKNNEDLNDRLTDLLKYKVNVGPDNNFRYDVRGNSLIKSLIQTNETNQKETIVIHRGTTVLEIPENGILISGLAAKFAELKTAGKTPVNTELIINHANTTGKTIFFTTDKPIIRNSPTVNDNRFDANWPGPLDQEFDKIFVKGGSLKILSGGEKEAKLVISYFEANDTATCNEEHKLNWLHFAKLFELNASGDIILKSDQNFKVTAENITQIADEIFLKSEFVDIGVNPKDYDESGDVIQVYGQEIDSRYAGRDIFENSEAALNQKIDDLDEKVDEEVERLDKEIESINEEVAELSEKLDSEIERSTEADIELNSKIIKEIEDRSKGDHDLGDRITNMGKHLQEQIPLFVDKAVKDGIKPVDDRLVIVENNYYDKPKVDTALDEFTYDKPTIEAMIASGGLAYDLIITNNAELKEAIEGASKKFENAMSILFRRNKTQNNIFEYTSTSATSIIDLSKVRFIKGEEPTDVILKNISCKNDEQIIVETITIKFQDYGVAGYKYLNSKSSQVKEIDLNSATQTVVLDKYFNIYKLNLNEDCMVTFENLDAGRHYTFYIDQDSQRKKFGITNKIHNYIFPEEFAVLDYIKNSSINSRTVIHVLGSDEAELNGLIINEVIPRVESQPEFDIRVILGNIEGKLYNSSKKDRAVFVNGGYNTGDIIAYSKNGKTLNINAEFTNGDNVLGNCTGWTESQDGKTWSLIEKTNGNVLAFGTIKNGISYTIPATLHDDIILEFKVEPQLVAVVIDNAAKLAGFDDKVNNRKGFYDTSEKKLYQAYYDKVRIEVVMKDADPIGWFIWKMETDTGLETTGAYIWEFEIKALSGELYTGNIFALPILPSIYRRLYRIKARVVGQGAIPFSTDVTLGENKIQFFDIDPNPAFMGAFAFYESLDPIRLAVYTSGIEYKSVSSPSYNGLLTISDPALLGNSQIDIITASGTKIPWNPKIVNATTDIVIAGEVAKDTYSSSADLGLAFTIYKTHKSPLTGSYEDVECHINWINVPGIGKGSWAIEGTPSIAQIIPFEPDPTKENSDKATLRIFEKGFVTLVFTSLDGKTIKQVVEVHVHVASGDIIPNIDPMTTNSGFHIDWFDRAGAGRLPIPSSKMTDVSGTWSVIKGQDKIIIDPDKNATLKAIDSIPATGYEITVQFVSNDVIFNTLTNVVLTYDLTVFRGIYEIILHKGNTETNYEGGAIEYPYFVGYDPDKGYLRLVADGNYVLRLQFKNGFTASNATVAEFAAKLGATIKGTQTSGLTVFEFTMPYDNVIIDVTSKNI